MSEDASLKGTQLPHHHASISMPTLLKGDLTWHGLQDTTCPQVHVGEPGAEAVPGSSTGAGKSAGSEHAGTTEQHLIRPPQSCLTQQFSALKGVGNLASILGDAQLPGWSARLILCLGGGAGTARPLACASRQTSRNLMRDAVQLSAELNPVAQALARASSWGEQEEAKFSCFHGSAAMLSVLARLDVGTSRTVESCNAEPANCVSMAVHSDTEPSAAHLASGQRRQTTDRAREAVQETEVTIEKVRVQRVGCLLASLARRVRSLSHRFAAAQPSTFPD